ncbi:unnamed protein product [marine sediment metagenome]|uniref:Uncharacterized protein n=1 Tax=marine sediment metagenome TaxID=412755 RepID=X0U4L1_9ZZZZ
MKVTKRAEVADVLRDHSFAHNTITNLLVEIGGCGYTQRIEAPLDLGDAKALAQRWKIVANGWCRLSDDRDDILLLTIAYSVADTAQTKRRQGQAQKATVHVVDDDFGAQNFYQRPEGSKSLTIGLILMELAEPYPYSGDARFRNLAPDSIQKLLVSQARLVGADNSVYGCLASTQGRLPCARKKEVDPGVSI